MFLIYFLILFGSLYGEQFYLPCSADCREVNKRFASMEAKIKDLESDIQILKSRNEDLEFKIEVKKVQADVSLLLAEQEKMDNRSVILYIKTSSFKASI